MGSESESVPQHIAEEASRWYARLQAPACPVETLAAFRAWQAACPEHARAWAEVERFATCFARLAAADARLDAMAEQAFAMGRDAVFPSDPAPVSEPRRHPWAAAAAIAASFAIAVVLVTGGRPQGPAELADQFAGTASSIEREVLNLADGSIVHLDVDSEVRAQLSQDARRLSLRRGRALFSVAHDPDRPFTVTADAYEIRAIGTEFQVESLSDRTVVTLTEGSVTVAMSGAHADHVIQLRPGEELTLAAGTAEWSKRMVDSQVATSWSRGRHVFREAPLPQALAEVNRYAARKVRIGEAGLADLTVSGNFLAGDSDRVVAAFAALLPLRVVDGGREIILFLSPRNEAAGNL